MKSSATDASTKTLDAAEHFWPAKLNALRAGAGGGEVEVGRGRDDHRVLAAHLTDRRLRVRRSERADDRHADGTRTGERHPVDARVPHQGRACVSASGHEVHDAGRHACRDEGVVHEVTTE